MPTLYALWHCQRQGWLTTSGTTSTEFKDALKVDHDEAIKRCSKHFNRGAGIVGILPVLIDDVQSIGIQ